MPVPKKQQTDGSKKKLKGPKKLKRKDGVILEDVTVHTSLPPQVDGQLRCHLRVSISQILWHVPNAPELTHVRLVWWGQHTKGALFRPVDIKRGEKRGPMHFTTARYPIRSGPKQLASYFADLGSLGLDVLSGPTMTTVGRATIDQLTALSPNKPINGFFPVMSADQEKVAELQVSIVLESLMVSFDSTSSIPTPDMSLNMRNSFSEVPPVNPPRVVPVPVPPPIYSSSDDPFMSPSANRVTKQDGHYGPRGVDRILFKPPVRESAQSFPSTVYSSLPRSTEMGQSGSSPYRSKDTLETVSLPPQQVPAPAQVGPPRTENLPGVSSLEDITSRGGRPELLSTGSSGGHDLVSELLERGQKLREAMIVSTLDEDVRPTGSHADRDGLREKNCGRFLQEILLESGGPRRKVDSRLSGSPGGGGFAIGGGFGSVGVGMGGGLTGLSDSSDVEDRLIGLVLGPDADVAQLKDWTGSGGSSVSGDDDIQSDPDDPGHEANILHELFYKNPDTEESDISLSSVEEEGQRSLKEQGRSVSAASLGSAASSLDDPGNKRPPSRSSRRSSCSSLNQDMKPTHDSDGGKSPRITPKKKKKKKKKTSRLSDEAGENDVLSSSRMSETSRVSFDPVPSDAEETPNDTKPLDSHHSQKRVGDGLSVERLTLLGRVHVARVTIDSLALSQSSQTTPTKSKSHSKTGRPPRPAKRVETYFVEYQFPVVATSRDKHAPNAMATEVMRVASKKVVDSSVRFGHRSVFPVLFDGEAVDKWWKSALVFKIYSRGSAQKVPNLLGTCQVPLKLVLKSDVLYLEQSVEVKDRSRPRSASSSSLRTSRSDWPLVGHLKLTVELASDSKDFPKVLARTRLAEMSNPKIVALPQTLPAISLPVTEVSTQKLSQNGRVRSTAGTQTEPQPTNLDTVPLAPPTAPPTAPPPVLAPPTGVGLTSTKQWIHGGVTAADSVGNVESLTLHSMLMIPRGENILTQGIPTLRHGDKNPSQPPKPLSGWTGRDMNTRNLYLVCRMFWCDDVARSGVCWGTVDPEFNFVQVAPMLLTSSLLERLRNNFVVIEVWDKKTSAENDELVGIVKLPLHQFYLSFRDQRVAAALLKSQYPVVAIDTAMPVISPFTGATYGQIQVLLSMGSSEQISSLQQVKRDHGSAVMVPERPLHYLERQHMDAGWVAGQDYASSDNMVEHVFEVSMEGVRGLQLLESMIWGEADCFIQYHFPTQTQTRQQSGLPLLHAGLSLKTFRTATTLCVPDPVFNDVIQHKVTMSEGSPVQREILTACAGAGGGAGGVPIEVWCRYYYPNTRDQVIAKATLPLAKLCAMVTMKRVNEANVQTFSLPLFHVGREVSDADDGVNDHQQGPPQSGLLDVTINYRTRVVRTENVTSPEAISRSLPGAQVCVSVSVLRASALKAAAVAAARHDASMQYASEVGVNTYIRVQLSFLQKQDERITRTVARSFAPEFSYHLDFPCPLLWTEVDCDALSLAEILETAEATFEVWHQAPSSTLDIDRGCEGTSSGQVTGRRLVSYGGDVLLGATTIPLVGLLKRATGIYGWFPINMPSVGWETDAKETGQTADSQSDHGHHGSHGLERVVGGLELAVKFAHLEDRERVNHAARVVGWAPEFDIESRDWEETDEMLGGHHEVTVNMDYVCCPLASTLITGQLQPDKNARMYVRYKFYDRGAVCSKATSIEENEDGYVTCDLKHAKILVVASSSPFNWYLHEERLEIQVWLTYQSRSGGSSPRPRNRDKLIGAAYIDLASLGDQRRRQHRISGVFPLFKPGSANLGGACLRGHVTLRPHTSRPLSECDDTDSDVPSSPTEATVRQKLPQKTKAAEPPPQEVNNPDTFRVHISIERALHVTHVSANSSERRAPSCYVSYHTAQQVEPVCTQVVPRTEDPDWCHQHDTRLPNHLLTSDNKNLVFKVWYKPDDNESEPDLTTDRVLGFVSVDLAPLGAGFPHIAGWYNIMDFNGTCRGQIKIAVTPTDEVTGLQKVISTNQQHPVAAPLPTLPESLCWSRQRHMDADTQGILARFSEHYSNVKHFHENLASRIPIASTTSQPAPTETSRSTLFDTLRLNLADLDTITERMQQRIQSGTFPPPQHTVSPREGSNMSPRDGLNHTARSSHTQPETETSALTNSHQFLPLPTDVTTATSTEGEVRRTADTTLSTTVRTGTLDGAAGGTGSSTLVSGLVHEAVGGLLGTALGTSHQGMGHGDTHTDRDTFLSYTKQGDSCEDDMELEPGSHYPWVGDRIDLADDSGEASLTEDNGDIVMPRPLNDVSNVNFDNMAQRPTAEEHGSRLSEEDSWFTSGPPAKPAIGGHPPRGDVGMPEGLRHLESGGGVEEWLGGTASTLGTVGEDDPYGRTLLGGQFNRAIKITLNYDDSWLTQLPSDHEGESQPMVGGQSGEVVGGWSDGATEGQGDGAAGGQSDRAAGGQRDRAAGGQSDRAAGGQSDRAAGGQSDRAAGGQSDRAAGGQSDGAEERSLTASHESDPRQTSSDPETQSQTNREKVDCGDKSDSSCPEYTVEERSLIADENPATFSPVSRISLSDSSSSKGRQARQAAVFRRKFEKHRRDKSSSDEDHTLHRQSCHQKNVSSDSEGEYDNKSRKRKESRRKTLYKNRDVQTARSRQSGSVPVLVPDRGSVESRSTDTLKVRVGPGIPHHNTPEHQITCCLPDKTSLNNPNTQQSGPNTSGNVAESPSRSEPSCDESHGLDKFEHQESGVPPSTANAGPTTSNKNTSSTIPNFFLPTEHLEKTMRSLQTQNLAPGGSTSVTPALTRTVVARITGAGGRFKAGAPTVKARPLPGPEHSQRIAKIFSKKFS